MVSRLSVCCVCDVIAVNICRVVVHVGGYLLGGYVLCFCLRGVGAYVVVPCPPPALVAHMHGNVHILACFITTRARRHGAIITTTDPEFSVFLVWLVQPGQVNTWVTCAGRSRSRNQHLGSDA